MKVKTIFFIVILNLTGGFVIGQQLVKDIYSGSTSSLSIYPFPFCTSNGVFFFSAYGSNNVGSELWKSDGTAAGTVLVKDIATGTNPSYVNFLTNVNGTLFFRACTDGNNSTYELWKSDGTTEGTNMIKDIRVGQQGSNPQNLIELNGNLFFTADDGINGEELWKSDGTTAGTVMIKDIYAGSISSSPKYLTLYNNELYFQAHGGFVSPSSGETLWKTDGTTIGTVMVTTTNKPGFPEELLVSNNFLFFSAKSSTSGRELWKTDGTSSGTVVVKDINSGAFTSSFPQKLIDVNGQLMFFANDGITGFELWKSDGTAAGTVLIKDINTGATGSFVNTVPNDFTKCAIGNQLYFRADDGINGAELWKTDGTSSGTVMLKNIYPGANSSLPNAFINFNGKLIFSANDDLYGTELYQSDGSAAGTTLIADISAGLGSSIPYAMHIFNSNLYFAASTSDLGTELWRYTGSPLLNISFSNEKISIYPNPATTILNIKLTDIPTIEHVTISDLSGKKIIEQKSNKTSINVESLAKGVYVLEVIANGNKRTNKFIKE